MTTVVEARGLVRTFRRGGVDVHALRGVDLSVEEGTMVAMHGRSGSGKTTLLNVVGGLDRPTEGAVVVCGTDLSTAGERERVELRRDRISFVFQAFGLLPVLSAAENVEVALRLQRVPPRERRARVVELLDLVGLAQRASHRPAELSGGEQQRVAIARALAHDPELLIADEPTGQLDSGTGRRVMDLLRSLVDERGLSLLLATHDPSLLDEADVVIEMRDGEVSAGGTVAPRFDGDVDRTRTLQESTTLPHPAVDPTTVHRRQDPDADPPARRPVGPYTPERVQSDDLDRADRSDGSGRGPLRFGPDGELLPDED